MYSELYILVIICHKSKNQSHREILNKEYHVVGTICNLKALFPKITIHWVESHQNYQNTIQVKVNSEADSIATYQIKVKGWCTSWLAWRPNWKGIWTRHIKVFWWTQVKAYIDNKHNIPPCLLPRLDWNSIKKWNDGFSAHHSNTQRKFLFHWNYNGARESIFTSKRVTSTFCQSIS